MRARIIIISVVLIIMAAAMGENSTEEKTLATSQEQENETAEKADVTGIINQKSVGMAAVIDQEESKYTLYDVPLDANLQNYIMYLCDEYCVSASLVMAVIERESSFDTSAIGDNGRSFGLMQIQEHHHSERMDRLGVDNLLNPYQNVLVGIDILAEKLANYDTVGEALTAYNAGDSGAYKHYFSKGIYASNYAEEIIKRAEELERRIK